MVAKAKGAAFMLRAHARYGARRSGPTVRARYARAAQMDRRAGKRRARGHATMKCEKAPRRCAGGRAAARQVSRREVRASLLSAERQTARQRPTEPPERDVPEKPSSAVKQEIIRGERVIRESARGGGNARVRHARCVRSERMRAVALRAARHMPRAAKRMIVHISNATVTYVRQRALYRTTAGARYGAVKRQKAARRQPRRIEAK